jgi:hypothetical protein
MTRPSLHDIIDQGDRMLAALEADEFDAFTEALQERDRLISSYTSGDRPAHTDTIASIVRELADQHGRLQAAMLESRTALGNRLGSFSKYRAARRAYHEGTVSGGGRLNKTLHG